MGCRYFALIPAAGHSSRMGLPKLLLALSGRPLIAHTIDAWQRSVVDRIVVIVRPGDSLLAMFLGEAMPSIRNLDLVIPDQPPPDMKASLQAALSHVEQQFAAGKDDAFLVAPADMPRLSPAIIDRLIELHRSGSRRILVPTIGGKH